MLGNIRRIPEHAALLVADMQRDFLHGGAVPVPGADAVIPAINHYVARFGNAGAAVFFSRDWHPADHCSFAAQGGHWPVHCVAGSVGAEFPAQMQVPQAAAIVSKGMEREHEAYSAFEGTALAELLHARAIEELWIAGVQTEHAVRASALDALRSGFRVMILVDAIRAIDRQPGDGERALNEMFDAGATGHAHAGSKRESRSARAAGIGPRPLHRVS
jgi:nicotinamidase/pyrazinamidase